MRAFILLLLISTSAQAREFKLLELDEVRINYRDYFSGGREPLITSNGLPDRELGQEVNLHMNVNMAKYLYFNNQVHSMTDRIIGSGGKGQFRVVGWEMGLGVRLSSYMSFGYYHFSKHMLDTTYAHDGFPVKDAIEVNIYLLRSDSKDSIF